MSRKIGSRVFRRELDDHEGRLGELEKGGGGSGLLIRNDIDFELGATTLLIGSGLAVDQTDVNEARLRSSFRIESNGMGFGFGADEQLAGLQLGDGLVMEDELSAEKLAIVSVDLAAPVQFVDLDGVEPEYTLQSSDVNKLIKVPWPGGSEEDPEVFDITIPEEEGSDIPIGSRIGIVVYSSGGEIGNVRILREENVTLASGHEIVETSNSPGAYIYLLKVDTNVWLVQQKDGFSLSHDE